MSHKTKLLFMSILLTFSLGSFAALATKSDYEEFKVKSSKKLEQLEVKLEKLKDKTVKFSGETKDRLIAEYKVLKRKTAKYKEDLENSSEDASDYTADKWKKFKDKMEDYGEKIESKLDETIN